jgi:Fur family ferric uptake transcriptional regulator
MEGIVDSIGIESKKMISNLQKKLRQTNQLVTIRGVFDSATRPLSVPEIHGEAQKSAENIGIATVYRAVQKLHDEGVVQVVTFPGDGQLYYERQHRLIHHHFLCRDCNRAYCLGVLPLHWEQLLPEGFVFESQNVSLSGLCGQCAKRP